MPLNKANFEPFIMTLVWILRLQGLVFHPESCLTEARETFLRKWNTYKPYQKSSGFEGIQVLLLIDSTNAIMGVCVILFLPYDWLESNHSFPNELKERK